ncbi:MAG TPA: ATP-binding protein [Calditrichia bacterium]|nr:ATP-binding protein [Calditrichia bacterium]
MQYLPKSCDLLIVEDSPEDRETYRRMINNFKFFEARLREAETGEEGLEMALRQPPDCIILDFRLPDMDGLEFMAALKERSDADIAVVMATGQGDEETAVEVLKSGVLDYLVKGNVSSETLYRAIMTATDRIGLRKTLKRKNAELEESNRNLQMRNEELKRFAYVVSHDLKQPLRTQTGFLKELERSIGTDFDAQTREYMDIILENSCRMEGLIDALLAYARLEASQADFKTFSMELPAGMARMNLRAAIEENNAIIEIGPMPEIEGDVNLLSVLFQNLIGNAIHYRSAEKPAVQVDCQMHNGEFRFAVRDNGIGIPPEKTEVIFQAFQRLHGYSQRPGNGLGLATCQKIVAIHGGQIWAESSGENGSTFYFTLPKPAIREKQELNHGDK